ncbi:fused MFS/spermidine synthase [Neptunicella marina]|uniref:Fused MFS/spermidine synthase n=1 Tax=Neptunicella marina TaxID=2125989 RepID=A0A8J6IUT2_9ALTE|nr:fused MFS/spermidine synthase [Neptunicella marina]
MQFDLERDLAEHHLLYFQRDPNVQSVSVLENEHYRWLKIGDVIHSVMDKSQPQRLVLPHLNPMMLALYYRPTVSNVLGLGLGGGALERYLLDRSEISLTSVELNPTIIDCYRNYFAIDDKPHNIVQADAQGYVTNATDIDLLLVDLFDHQSNPAFLSEPEFYQQCMQALTPNGLLVVNLLPVFDLQLYDIEDMLEELFDSQVLCFSVPGYINRILICSRQPLADIPFDQAFYKEITRLKLDLNFCILNR